MDTLHYPKKKTFLSIAFFSFIIVHNILQKIMVSYFLQGLRKLCYGEGLSKNVGYHGWLTTKEFKFTLAKTP